jgi:hypothetical protein
MNRTKNYWEGEIIAGTAHDGSLRYLMIVTGEGRLAADLAFDQTRDGGAETVSRWGTVYRISPERVAEIKSRFDTVQAVVAYKG